MSLREASDVLREIFGYEGFRPVQQAAVEASLAGRDVQLLLPTGGGKSLCYQVPAIVRWARGEGATLVVSPLIALMQDQVDALQARGVPAVALHSMRDADGHREARRQASGAALIYVSPERIAKPAARRALAAYNITAVAIDEAHCISQWGHDFRKDYLRLGAIKPEFDVPIMAVTATATRRVMEEIRTSLGMVEPAVLSAGLGRENLRFSVEHIQGDKARVARAAELLHACPSGRAILYASTRKNVVNAAAALRKQKLKVAHYHAGRTPGAREKAQADFASGKRPIMVATNAFGMGIDQPDVRLVVHLQAPGSLEAWYQEAGRAGRDGKPAQCVLLYAHSDSLTQARLRGKRPPPGADAGWKAMQNMVFSTTCRQQSVEEWFTGKAGPGCGRCDVCEDVDAVRDNVQGARKVSTDRAKARSRKAAADAAVVMTAEQEQSVIDFVDGLRKPLGARLVTQGLRGSRAKAALRKGLAKNEQYGVLKSLPERTILDCIDTMLADGRLVRKGRKYPTLWLPEKRVRPVRTGPPKPRRSKYTGVAAELAKYRSKQARKKRWKPYQIFNNATLAALVEAAPQTLTQLADVPGMGPKRVERYGADLLAIFSDPAR